tara:strand:- start:938 stop:2140 length:1203 start_codon:yes stop_codon:yes gene_type:complete
MNIKTHKTDKLIKKRVTLPFQFLGKIILLVLFTTSTSTFAEESPENKEITPDPTTKSKLISSNEEQDDEKKRSFYQVLEDVLSDFEYDVKSGDVRGLTDLSVRNVVTSENVPESFKSHLELLTTERILKNSQTRMIQCIPCRSRTARLSGNNVVISSPESHPEQLARLAKKHSVKHFLDIAFAYLPTGLLLSLYITDAENQTIIWSRTYNSETSRAAAFRRGVDYSQVDQARHQADYEPTLQYRVILYYMFERNLNEYNGTIGLGFRMMERYDNRKKEVGFELDYFRSASSFFSTSTDTSTVDVWNGFNLSLLFMHAWNLIGNLENYNKIRGSIFVGIGGTYTSGFLGGLIRGGYEWRLGKHWGVNANIGYRPPATAFLDGTAVGTLTGIEGGVGVSALF